MSSLSWFDGTQEVVIEDMEYPCGFYGDSMSHRAMHLRSMDCGTYESMVADLTPGRNPEEK